jgi:hypothetical protein
MAELRTAEESVARLRQTYASLQRSQLAFTTTEAWPELAPPPEQARPPSPVPTAAQVLRQLTLVRATMQGALGIQMIKFRKRLSETDPITENPRYGDKTHARVTRLLQAYEDLDESLRLIYNDDDNNDNNNNKSEAADALVELQHKAALEEAANMEALRIQQETERAAVAAVVLAQEARLKDQREAAAAAEDERQRQREAVETEALQAIEMERRAVAQAARAAQEWQARIPRGAGEVRKQLQSLLSSTVADTTAQTTAIEALHTIFSQIVARPEDVKFRRIRRNHPQFQADIGRHVGGRETLIAAGFRLGSIDDVPSFISTEPDIAKDMDGWSAWFDLLKETLAVIEDALIKL